jgi:transcriptional regulator with XRE-family HTH domain
MGKLGKRIKDRRSDLGMSVRDLAARLRKSPGYVSRLETRGEIPSPELICALAEILDESAEDLLALSKADALQRVERQIEEKHSDALLLFRKKHK